MLTRLLLCCLVTTATFTGATTVAIGKSPRATQSARSSGGVVVSDSKIASEIGTQVLNSGGNAVDSAVAVAFALAVTWPEAGNIGGGGFMLVAPPDGEVECIEYREKAPLKATQDMFVGLKDPLASAERWCAWHGGWAQAGA